MQSSPGLWLVASTLSVITIGIAVRRWHATVRLFGHEAFEMVPLVLKQGLKGFEKIHLYIIAWGLLGTPIGILVEWPAALLVYHVVLTVSNLFFAVQPPAVLILGVSAAVTAPLVSDIGIAASPLRRTTFYEPRGIFVDFEASVRSDRDTLWFQHVTLMMDIARVIIVDLRAGLSRAVERELREIARGRRGYKTIVLSSLDRPFFVPGVRRNTMSVDEAVVLIHDVTRSRQALLSFYASATREQHGPGL